MKSNYLLIDKVRIPLVYNRARIYKSSRKAASNAVSGGKYQQSPSFRHYTRCFGRTGYNNFMMPKAKLRDLKSAIEEATRGIWTANPQRKPCFLKSSLRPSSSNNLSCSKYEPLSLAATTLAHSLWKTFEVFRFGAFFFALEKGHDLLCFFFEDISTTNKAITLERLIGACKAKHAVLLSRDF